jgi:hypothetical protein
VLKRTRETKVLVEKDEVFNFSFLTKWMIQCIRRKATT